MESLGLAEKFYYQIAKALGMSEKEIEKHAQSKLEVLAYSRHSKKEIFDLSMKSFQKKVILPDLFHAAVKMEKQKNDLLYLVE